MPELRVAGYRNEVTRVMNGLPIMPNAVRPHLSASAISEFEACETAFKYRYVLNHEGGPVSFSRAFGRAMHKMAENDSNLKIRQNPPLSIADAKDVFLSAFEDELREASFSKQDQAEFGLESRAKTILRQQGLKCAGLWVREISRQIDPVSVEQRFRLPLVGDYDFVGIIDLIARPGSLIPWSDRKRVDKPVKDMRVVVDLKFGRGRRPLNAMESRQLTIYFGAHAYLTSSLADFVVLLQLKRSEQGPTWKMSVSARTAEDFEAVIRYSDFIAEKTAANNFQPTGLGTWKCDVKFCSFFDICEERKAYEGQ